MGFNVTALAQKARTKTLIVDSDLDMGQYDVIATDVKGNTAEFSEFVGGVGNFESGLISGGLDVGDILHAESSMQIDGDLVVEGAINNVNITNEGAISTAKSVTATGGFKGNLQGNVTGALTGNVNGNVTGNVTGSISGGTVAGSTGTFSGAVTGASFNGIPLKTSGVITVTPTNTFYTSPMAPDGEDAAMLLPFALGTAVYTGSIKIKSTIGASSNAVYVQTSAGGQFYNITNTATTISFTQTKFVKMGANTSDPNIASSFQVSGFTLS